MMEIGIALLHFFGAMVFWLLMNFGGNALLVFRSDRVMLAMKNEVKIKHGIDLYSEVITSVHERNMLKEVYESYSCDHLRNRVSGFFIGLSSVFGVIAILLCVGYLSFVAYISIANDTENAVHFWWIIPISLPLWILGYLISTISYYLTGMHAGQAAVARKIIELKLSDYDTLLEGSERSSE